MNRAAHYVGCKGGVRTVFRATFTPTTKTHGERFAAVIGPFRTKRAATLCAAFAGSNPHLRNVEDAERLAAAGVQS